MSLFNENLPEWNNIGSEVPSAVKDVGWQVKDKPPAAWFNWLSNRVYECILEIRNVVDTIASTHGIDNFIVSTGTPSAFIFTPNPAITSYQDGMSFLVKFHTGNVQGDITVDISGLGPIPLVTKDYTSLQKFDVVSGELYKVAIVDNKAVILDIQHKTLSPQETVEINANNMNYEGMFTVDSTVVANTPFAEYPEFAGTYLFDIIVLPSVGMVWQRAIQLESFTEFHRYINLNTNVAHTGWIESLGTDGKNLVYSSDIFQVWSSAGLSHSSSGLNFTVNPGHIYTPFFGLVRKNTIQTVVLPANSTRYLNIRPTGALSLSTTYNSALTVYTVTTSAAAVSSVVFVGIPLSIQGGLLGVTQPSADNSKKLATTEFVKSITSTLGSGKRFATKVVGSSAAGYTASDVDYLCDGVNDQVEINAAIASMANGGKVVLLEGSYTIGAKIEVKNKITLEGQGASSTSILATNNLVNDSMLVLQENCKITGLFISGFINSANNRDGILVYGKSCTIENNTFSECKTALSLNGSNNTVNSNMFVDNKSDCIYIETMSNTVVGNICNSDYGCIRVSGPANAITGNTCSTFTSSTVSTGIYVNNNDNTISGNTCSRNTENIFIVGNRNTVTGNICSLGTVKGIQIIGTANTITGNTCNNNYIGIHIDALNSSNTITGNNCNNNDYAGIYQERGNNSNIVGNTCIRGTGLSSDYSTFQHTILIEGAGGNNLIAINNIMGKNVKSTNTTNMIFGNKWDASTSASSELSFVYKCTGTNDDLAIQNLINNFFDSGTAMSMKLIITGTMHLQAASTNLISINSVNTRGASVHLDFSDCTIPPITLASRIFLTINGNVIVAVTGLNVTSSSYAVYVTGYDGTNKLILNNCVLKSDGSAGMYMYSGGTALITGCIISGTSGLSITGPTGNNRTIALVNNCVISGTIAHGVNISGTTKATLNNCTITSRDYYGLGAGVSIASNAIDTAALLNNCIIKGGGVYCADLDNKAVLNNCTFTGGTNTVVNIRNTGQVTLSNCEITSVATNVKGLDISAGGVGLLNNCTIKSANIGVSVTGIAILSNCTITSNSTTFTHAAIINFGKCTVNNCELICLANIFCIYSQGASTTIVNNCALNFGLGSGSGIYVVGTSQVIMNNCIFTGTGTGTPISSNGVSCDAATSTVTLTNCVITNVYSGVRVVGTVTLTNCKIIADSTGIQVPSTFATALKVTSCKIISSTHGIDIQATNTTANIMLQNNEIKGTTQDVYQASAASTVRWYIVGNMFSKATILIDGTTAIAYKTATAVIYFPQYANKFSQTIT